MAYDSDSAQPWITKDRWGHGGVMTSLFDALDDRIRAMYLPSSRYHARKYGRGGRRKRKQRAMERIRREHQCAKYRRETDVRMSALMVMASAQKNRLAQWVQRELQRSWTREPARDVVPLFKPHTRFGFKHI